MSQQRRLRKHRMRLTLAAVVPAILLSVAAGVATASTRDTTFQLHANLTVGQQSPAQTIKAPNAAAQFTGTLLIQSKHGTLTWRLSYSGLSGRPMIAEVLLPRSGKHGEVVVELCHGTQCASGTSKTNYLPAIVATDLSSRKGHVTITTKENPSGETSGKLVVTH
jgi:hypothetical protein